MLHSCDKLLDWVKSIVSAVSYVPNRPFLKVPLADGSVIYQHYPMQVDDTINLVAFLHKNRRQPVQMVVINEPDADKHLSSSMANLVHGGDASALVCLGWVETLLILFTTFHVSVSARPCKDMDVLQFQFRKGLYESFWRILLEEFVTFSGLSVKGYLPFYRLWLRHQRSTHSFLCLLLTVFFLKCLMVLFRVS